MRRKIGLCLILLLVISTFLLACSKGQQTPEQSPAPNSAAGGKFPLTLVDSLGRQVTIEKEPQKIISLSPAITEILFAIGVGDKIIGVTDFCDYPEEALQKPKVGGFDNPNMEVIINSEPDVVFTAAGLQSEFVQQLERLGIVVVTLDAKTLEDVLANIELAGQVTGATEKARELSQSLAARIEAVKEKVSRAKEKPTVFFEVWDNPLMTAGPGSFIYDMIELSGGQNVAFDVKESFADFSVELLIERDPEFYLINSHAHTPEDVKKRPGYEGLKAVKNNRVYAIEDDLVTLPGPRIVDGLEEMARIFHPELFK